MSSAADRLKLYADAQPPGSALLPCGGGPMLWMSDLREVLAQLNRATQPASVSDNGLVQRGQASLNQIMEMVDKHGSGPHHGWRGEIYNAIANIIEQCAAFKAAPAGAVVAQPDLASRLNLLETAIEEVHALIPQRLGAEHLREKLQSIVHRVATTPNPTGEKK